MKPVRAITRPPLIRSVKSEPPRTLTIEWSTGESLPVDVSRLVRRFRLYAPLKSAAFFRKAKADPWGHAVNWPGDVDMGADQLYELSREQAGEWGPERLKNGWPNTAFRSIRRRTRSDSRGG